MGGDCSPVISKKTVPEVYIAEIPSPTCKHFMTNNRQIETYFHHWYAHSILCIIHDKIKSQRNEETSTVA